MSLTRDRKRKSEALTQLELTKLTKYLSGFPTSIDAAEALGVSRQTLDRVKIIGRGSPETIGTIRKRLNKAA